jgi:hypothetical protein
VLNSSSDITGCDVVRVALIAFMYCELRWENDIKYSNIFLNFREMLVRKPSP